MQKVCIEFKWGNWLRDFSRGFHIGRHSSQRIDGKNDFCCCCWVKMIMSSQAFRLCWV